MLRSFLIVLLFTYSVPTVLAQAGEKPNFLFIVIDDLNDRVGHLGRDLQVETPHIDSLAFQGTQFINAFANLPQCVPSRMSFMTGKLADYTGAYDGGDFNSATFRDHFDGKPVFTIPEILKDSAGYFTLAVNKVYHSANPNGRTDWDDASADDCDRGWSWNRYPKVENMDEEPEPLDGLGDGNEWLAFWQVPDESEAIMRESRVIDTAIALLDAYAANPADFCDRPLFMAVGLRKPHLPWFIPEKYFEDAYDPTYQNFPQNWPEDIFPASGALLPPNPPPGSRFEDLGEIGQITARDYNEDTHGAIQQTGEIIAVEENFASELSPAERVDAAADAFRANALMAYRAATKYSDALVGRLLEALDSHPALSDNTIVILVSDHGFSLGEKTHWRKMALWDTALRVPFIFRVPGSAPGQVVTSPVSLVDLMPTILELAGVEASVLESDNYMDGNSFVSMLSNPNNGDAAPALSALDLPNSSANGGCFEHHAVRSAEYRYIRYKTDGAEGCDSLLSDYEEELYRIGRYRERDPNEWFNLANDPAYAEVKDWLAQYLPGGSLEKQQIPSVKIVMDEWPCPVEPGSNLQLRAQWYDENGVALSGAPAGYFAYWKVGDIAETASESLDLKVPSKGLPDEPMVIILQGIRSVDNSFNMDRAELPVGQSGKPQIDFTLRRAEGYLAEVSWAERSPYIFDERWNFNGAMHPGGEYPAWDFSVPGAYEVTRSVKYGPASNPCEADLSRLIIMADPEGEPGGRLQLAPNPASDYSIIRYRVPEPGNYRLFVLDAMGREVWVQELELDRSGEHQLLLNTLNWNKGSYVLSDGENTTRLLVGP